MKTPLNYINEAGPNIKYGALQSRVSHFWPANTGDQLLPAPQQQFIRLDPPVIILSSLRTDRLVEFMIGHVHGTHSTTGKANLTEYSMRTVGMTT